MPDAQWQGFEHTRTGMIAGKLVADKYGWKVGDMVFVGGQRSLDARGKTLGIGDIETPSIGGGASTGIR